MSSRTEEKLRKQVAEANTRAQVATEAKDHAYAEVRTLKAELRETREEIQDTKRYLWNANEIILKEAGRHEERARTLRILALDDLEDPDE